MNVFPKLGSIVRVLRPRYAHLGEVLSLVTPEQTVMVRMVPGDPTTLQEIPVASLEYQRLHPKWVHYARVKGGRHFPVDMLRYEACAPVNFHLGTNGVFDIAIRNQDAHGSDHLMVAYASPIQAAQWTTARWKSFGWTCERHKTLKLGAL